MTTSILKIVVRATRWIFTLMLALAPGAITGCGGSGPCHGSECGSNSMGSGNFTPGPFPHSVVALDGARCHDGPAEVSLFLGVLFTDPDPPQVVHPTDPLRVYWSVCNAGLTDAPAQPGAYSLTPTLLGPPPVTLASIGFDIPALTHCTCDVQSHLYQNVLTPGTYTFALSGAISGSVNRNITP